MLLLISILFLIAGIFCVGYTILIISYSGAGTAFLWFWILAAIGSFLAFGLFALFHTKHIFFQRIWYYAFSLLIICGAAVFLLVEGNIFLGGMGKAAPKADYMIVLGAQVKGRTVSKALKNRLDTALKYLLDNPQTTVIVSGGQGRGEEITEALAMRNYLADKGINTERILLEDKSVNTYENLVNSKGIIDSREASDSSSVKVVVVTNRFHVFRALSLARTQGIKVVQGLGAPNDDILTLHYYVREFFGVVKDVLQGNMKWYWHVNVRQ